MVKSVFSPAPTRNIESTAAPVFDPHSFRPLDDQVLIRRDDREKFIHNLEIPGQYQRKQLWGRVVKTGPGHRVGGVDRFHPKVMPEDRKAGKTPCKECMARGAVLPMTVRIGDHVAYLDVGHEVAFMDGSGAEFVVMGEGQLLGYERDE